MTHPTTTIAGRQDIMRSTRRRKGRIPLTLAVLLAVLVAASASAQAASFGIADFDGEVTANAAGDAYTQAGGHPFSASTSIRFNAADDPDPGGWPVPAEDVKDIHVELPPGLVGNPQGMPQCSMVDFAGSGGGPVCDTDTIVGVATTEFLGMDWYWPVFNLVSPPDVPATFGFYALVQPVMLSATLRSAGDYGLDVDVPDISQGLSLASTALTFWGVPADPAHDDQRCTGLGYMPTCFQPIASRASRKPFLTLPTSCPAAGVGLTTKLLADSWVHPGAFDSASFVSHLPPSYPAPVADRGPAQGTTGCERLPFDAQVQARVASRAAASPTGLSVDITVPDDGLLNADGLASAHLKKAVVTLPEGMSVNPAAADGLAGCAPAQIALKDTSEPTCPAGSKIGSVRIDTPLLADPMAGSVYLARQQDNPFGSLLAMYLVAKGPGLVIKLAGKIDADPVTGRLTTTFDDNPQLPFTTLHLELKGGARAPLTTPASCGTSSIRAELTPWNGGTPVVSESPVTVDQGCEQAGRFDPGFEAGVVNPRAGASSPFVLKLSRTDGQQELGALNGSLPAGLLGVLKSVPLCPAAQGAAGTCGAQSRVGKVVVAAGAGANPTWLPMAGRPEQSVYLTAPFRPGDVAGLSIVVPAVAGPFDLGTVVTRAFLKLRPKDQGVDLQTDPLPRILQGIPLQLREVIVSVDRPGFMVNPTSCRAMNVGVNVFSQSWAKAPRSTRFQVGGCAALPLSPVIGVSSGGKGNTARFTHPSLKVSVRQPAGQAHLDKVDVVLPKAFNVDLQAPSLKAACPRQVYAQDRCSKTAIVGTVRAVTPLLAEPLTGPAFLLQKKGELPDIVMRLRNSQMSLDLIGVLDFLKDSRVITRVRNIPDAALSSFELNIRGGKGGSLLNRSDLCAKRAATQATFRGQNGKVVVKSPTTRISGCAAKAASSRGASRAASERAAASRQRAARGRS